MRNYFTLDGVDSRDFGVYISGQGTFNASGRDYNIIPVPGRNGDLVGPEKRFLNGTLTYPAFIYANFKQQIEAFRNFLLSLVGYHDLIDSYHPNEIRKVLFEGPFSAEVEPKNDAGSFDIEFNCKPQRYLASGQEVITFEAGAGETETYSGEVATFDNPDNSSISALSVAVEPVQDLHGYDYPWPAGGGVNKLDIATVSIRKPAWYPYNWFGTTKNANAGITQELAYENGGAGGFTVALKPGETYTVSWTYDKSINASCKFFASSYNGTEQTIILDNETVTSSTTRFSVSFTVPSDSVEVAIRPTSVGATQSGQTYDLDYIQIELGSTATAWTPYENLCPISGWDAVDIWNKPTHDTTLPPTVTIQLGQTVYGGTLDAVNGTMTLDMAMVEVPNVTNIASSGTGTGKYIQFSLPNASRLDIAPVAEAMKGVLFAQRGNAYQCFIASGNVSIMQSFVPADASVADVNSAIAGSAVVYPLATPIVIQLDPVTISTISGQTNNVWADAGDVTVEVFTPEKPVVTNPTRFASQPLLRVYGVGALGVGSQTVTITQADEYTDIDCEMMDAFKGTANKNPYVQLTDHNFPVFKPGVNNISLGAGITKVEITPRWWIV